MIKIKNRNLQEEIHQQKKTIQNLETAINDLKKFHQKEISTIKEAHEAKLVSIDSERTFLVQTNNSRNGLKMDKNMTKNIFNSQ